MALKIRLRRMGRKKAPHYRIVVAESTMPRDGRFVAKVGHYNPTTTPATLVVDRDKAIQWMAKGAMPTDTVQSLFKKAGVFNAEPGVVAQAAEAVTGTAKKAAKAVSGVAAAAAGAVASAASAVAEAASNVVETVTERVSGGSDEAAEASTSAGDAVAVEAEATEPAADEQA